MTKNFGQYQSARTAQIDMGRYFLQIHEPFPKRPILDSSKMEEFADDNLKTAVENNMGKEKKKMLVNETQLLNG